MQTTSSEARELATTTALQNTLVSGPPAGLDDALGETIAAPLPDVADIEVEVTATVSASILPRLERDGKRARLVRSEGPRYETRQVLGSGAMGEVSLAHDRDIGRKVAVKRLHRSPESAPAVARFVDEVRTVGQLEHPNIVPIHDVGVDASGKLFFVMKYVDGVTLEDVIAALRRGDPEACARYHHGRRLEIMMGVLRALEYAHQRGIIHRDVKPANVMIGKNGEVVLMDWGVARPIAQPEADASLPAELMNTAHERASATHAGTLVGTPLYMSPEQAAGKSSHLDARSDLYSACQMFYELFALRHRFEDKPTLVLLLAAIQMTDRGRDIGEFMRPHLAPAAAPSEVAHYLRRGLALDPDARWQSATEMLMELERIVDGRCRMQCPATTMKRASREFALFIDRHPTRAMVAVGSVAATFVALAVTAVIGVLT